MFGFTKLKEITGISYKGLMTIFSWVGIEPPDEKLLDLCGNITTSKTQD